MVISELLSIQQLSSQWWLVVGFASLILWIKTRRWGGESRLRLGLDLRVPRPCRWGAPVYDRGLHGFVSMPQAEQRAITSWMTYWQEPFPRNIFQLPRKMSVFFSQTVNVPTAWLSSHGGPPRSSRSGFRMWQWSAIVLMWRLRLATQALQLS